MPMKCSRLWELRHTRFDEVIPEHDFWYAINKSTGKTVSSWELDKFTDRAWLKARGLPAYLAKQAGGDTLSWWEQLYRTGRAPGYDHQDFLSTVSSIRKLLLKS